MKFKHNDGGRAEAGYKGKAGDCVTRSIAIATGKPHQEIYDEINTLAKKERKGKRSKSSARNGVYKWTIRKYMASLGWKWTPTMHIGSGCRVHLKADELPTGRLVVSISRHIAAVIDGVIHDTHGTHERFTLVMEDGIEKTVNRCVYGYWEKE